MKAGYEMTTDYYAYTLVGIRVEYDRLYKKEKIRSCSHPFDKSGPYMKYCPVCGAPIWRTTKKPIDPFLSDDDYYDVKAFGLDLIHVGEEKYAYIGIILGAVDECEQEHRLEIVENLDNANIMQHHDRIKDSLKEYSFWGETVYGLWTIMQIST